MANKVYGVGLVASPADHKRLGKPARMVRAIIFAPSLKVAAAAFDTPLSHLRNYGGQTWNDGEIAAATAQPGVVLIRSMDEYGGEYVPRAEPGRA